MQTQIRFTTNGANSAFGGFTAGDIMRCSAELAKHLVEDMKCAKYMEAPKVEVKATVTVDAQATAESIKAEVSKHKRKAK